MNTYYNSDAAMQVAQSEKNKRRRLILIGIAVLLVLTVVIAVIAGAISRSNNPDPEGQVAPTVTAPATPDTTPTPTPTAGTATPPVVEPAPTVDGGYVAPTPTPTPTPVADNEADSSYANLLALLPVEAEQTNGYDRDLFNHWVTQGDGCDTREHVLAEEAQNGSTRNCTTTGTWVSLYDGRSITDTSKLDIDHMVPLAEAWGSGAWAWDADTREAYANDITWDGSLIAVTAGSNRSKSDGDPAEWMPSSMDRCLYAVEWMLVKYRWSLTVDPTEQATLSSWAGDCADSTVNLPAQATVVEDTAQPVTNQPAPAAGQGAQPNPGAATDPQFPSCKDAKAAGFGPYVRGTDPEYNWYRDGDNDGTVCE